MGWAPPPPPKSDQKEAFELRGWVAKVKRDRMLSTPWGKLYERALAEVRALT